MNMTLVMQYFHENRSSTQQFEFYLNSLSAEVYESPILMLPPLLTNPHSN